MYTFIHTIYIRTGVKMPRMSTLNI